MDAPRLSAFAFILFGQDLSIGISDEGDLDQTGELETQLDQLKIRYSPKGVALNSSGMDLNQ